jgi:AcrR family transcriptional regulator
MLKTRIFIGGFSLTDKEKAIIDSGMKLFARKGYSSTSIQEIATESGISKGAFYLHFKSKDDLLLAILEYIFNTIESSALTFENQALPARERFIKQLTATFGTFIGHKEFLTMLSKEQAIPRNREIKQLFFKKRFDNHLFYRKGLVSIYGKNIETYSTDLAMILEGLFQSYIGLLIFEPLEFDIEDLAQFLMRRMDSIVRDITNEQPLVTEDKLQAIFKKSKGVMKNTNIVDTIQKMRNELDQQENKDALEVSLDVLEEEILKQTPRIPVIQGMLSNFKEIKSFETYRNEIASFYGFELT